MPHRQPRHRPTARVALGRGGVNIRKDHQGGASMSRRLELETTAPFQGLPELVAYDEGLFAAEGLDVQFVPRGEKAPAQADRTITSPVQVDCFGSHGSSVEAGKAAMFNACEWGNYGRVASSTTGGR